MDTLFQAVIDAVGEFAEAHGIARDQVDWERVGMIAAEYDRGTMAIDVAAAHLVAAATGN